MGTPNEQIWPGVSQLPDFGLKFPSWKPQSISNVIVKRLQDKELSDLFAQIMILDPYKRISAKNAMQHPFFSNVETVSHVPLPDTV